MNRGFSLIELLVVTAVLTILSSVVLFNNGKFGGTVILRNLAYDMALSIREAQTYGISVRKFGVGAGQFGAGYGVHYQLSSNTQYMLFADVETANGLYGGANELVQTFTIGRGFIIDALCGTPSGGAEACTYQSLDVLFERPEPDAQIRFNGNSTLFQQARIRLRSPRGDVAHVLIEATGQISIQ